MANEETTRTRRGCGRRLAAVALLSAMGLAALGAGLLYTGTPQRLSLQYALSSQLGGVATVESVSLRNPLTVQGLTIAARGASIYGPPLRLEEARVAYALRPESGRYLASVALDGLQIAIQQGVAENNFQFLADRFRQPGGGEMDITPFLPERVSLSDLWVEIDFPSYYLRANNLGFQAELAALDRGSIALNAPVAGLAWSSVHAPGGPQSGAGAVRVNAAWDGQSADLDAEIDLGPLARLRGTASWMQRDGQPFLSFSVPEAAFEDPLWAAMVTDLSSVPFHFERLVLADTDVHLHRSDSGIVIDQANVDARIPLLTVGPAEDPYYQGPLDVAVRGQYGDETTITGKATLLNNAKVEASVRHAGEGAEGSFTWDPWPRELIAQLAPEAYAGALEILKPLNRLGARGDFAYGADGLRIDAVLALAFGDAAPVEAPLAVSRDASGALELETALSLHGGNVKSRIVAPMDAPVSITSALSGVQLNPWTVSLLGDAILPGFSGAISGSALLTLPPDAPVALDLDLKGAGLRYGDVVLPEEAPVEASGRVALDLDASRLASERLRVKQEGLLDASVSRWSFDIARAAMRGGIDGTLSLDAVARMFDLSDLYGDAAIQGALSITAEETSLGDFTARSGSFGYGDYSVPYGEELELAGSLAYAYTPNSLQLAPVRATIGALAAWELGALAFQFPVGETPFSMRASAFALETDLDLLVRRGMLGAAESGRATLRGEDFAWTGEAFSGAINWDLRAASLALPEKMASFDTIAWAGQFSPAGGESGGRLTAAHFTIYEIPFGAADTFIRIGPDHLACDRLATTFLGGNLIASGRFDYLDPAVPGTLDVEVAGLDLAEFTRIFKPPDLMLTGKVSGDAEISLSLDGLRDLHVDLVASENLSMNRGMVRQILMSQYVNDAVGSKSVQRVIEKVIGNDDQRPFEKATLQLRLEDGLIKGVARLESKSLDVTVDISAEPAAILEAMRSTAQQER